MGGGPETYLAFSSRGFSVLGGEKKLIAGGELELLPYGTGEGNPCSDTIAFIKLSLQGPSFLIDSLIA